MPRKGFRSLTIPVRLYEKLEKFIEESNGYYVTVSEVVRSAIREFLKKN